MRAKDVNKILARYSGHTFSVMRISLGFVILLAGTHKLFRPEIWASYTAPWVAEIISSTGIPLNTLMRVHGVIEAILGLAILAEVYTAIAAGLVSLSLLGIVLNLWSAGTGVSDVLIRDLGLLALAVGVTLMAAERSARPVHSRF